MNAESISYVETHGTGTELAIRSRSRGSRRLFAETRIGRVTALSAPLKTNIGHLDAAAGIAGLIKTVLALKHRQLPASLNFQSPNPEIDFQNTPFYVNSSLTEWKSHDGPRRAGVTSLGIGGTNAHVVLEEAPEQVRRETHSAPSSSSRCLPERRRHSKRPRPDSPGISVENPELETRGRCLHVPGRQKGIPASTNRGGERHGGSRSDTCQLP